MNSITHFKNTLKAFHSCIESSAKYGVLCQYSDVYAMYAFIHTALPSVSSSLLYEDPAMCNKLQRLTDQYILLYEDVRDVSLLKRVKIILQKMIDSFKHDFNTSRSFNNFVTSHTIVHEQQPVRRSARIAAKATQSKTK